MEKMKIPHNKYGVILADPAWQYTMRSDKGYGKCPDQHYKCMTYDELVALRFDIHPVCQKNCVLFMWAVWPMLPQAMKLMAEWGFEYKTGGAWHKRSKTWTPETPILDAKTSFGTGYIFRSASEPYILGTRGKPNIKNRSTRNVIETIDEVPQDFSLIEAAIREHSRKPDKQYPMLEALFEGPYLELFARQPAPGWVAAGNESSKFQFEGGNA